MKLKNLVAASLSAVSLLVGGHAFAQPAPVAVGLELMLLVDVSGSVDETEYNLQKTGYVNAFNNAAVQNAIINSQGGAIAVTYIEWSGTTQQATKVGWTLINSAATATAFATAISNNALFASAFGGSTAVQDAMGKSYRGFGLETGGTENGFTSLRQVIDLSGDGVDNDSRNTAGSFGAGAASGCNANTACGRDAALTAGVDTINGIYIGANASSALATYYNNNVKGGANGFAIGADSFSDFGDAIQNKLIREITNQTPEPSSLALVGLALLGAGLVRRRAAKA